MPNCFDALRAALSKDVSDKEIKDFISKAEELKKSSESSASAMEDFRQKMMAKIEAQREMVARYKLEKSQNVLKNNERWSRMNQPAYEGKPWEALAAESQGARNYIARGGNNGIRNISDSISNAILRPLRTQLDKIGALEYMKQGALEKEVSQELFELKEGGQPGISKSPVAQQVANVFRAANDRLRLEYKNAGYPIGNIPGYIVRQTHDFLKIKQAGFEKWSQEILQGLDHDKTFGEGSTEKSRTDFLKAAYNDIVNQRFGPRDVPNGVSDKFTSVTERGAGSKLAGSRSLHFQDGESFSNYNASYGKGNLLEVLARTVDRDSRNIAQLKKYGTNPLDSFAADYDKMERYYQSDTAAEKYGDKAPGILEKLQGQKKSLMAGYKIAAGISEPVGDSLPAKLSSMARALNNMSLLGMSVFKKPTELAYGTMLTKSATGSSFLKTTYQIAKDFMTLGLPGSEKEQGVLNKLLVNYIDDTNASLYTDRYGGSYNEPGMLSRASDLMYKFSGINAHTNRGRIAIGATIARILESNSQKSFDQLPARLQGNFSRYEISPKDWDVMRSEGRGVFDHDGSSALLPESIKDAKVQQKYMNFMNELTEMSVLHSNIPAIRAIRGNIDPNTVPGMLWTTAMQYKSVALMMQDVSERVTLSDPNGPTEFLKSLNPKNGGDFYNNLVPMMAYGSALYYIGDAMKRALKGQKPMDPTDPQTGIKSFVGGAGGGLYADFLIGQDKKMSGESIFKSAAGPTGSKVYDLADNLGKIRAGDTKHGESGLVKQFEDLVPGQTLPFARSALDGLLFDHIQNSIDPQYTEKRELRRLKQERGK